MNYHDFLQAWKPQIVKILFPYVYALVDHMIHLYYIKMWIHKKYI